MNEISNSFNGELKKEKIPNILYALGFNTMEEFANEVKELKKNVLAEKIFQKIIDKRGKEIAGKISQREYGELVDEIKKVLTNVTIREGAEVSQDESDKTKGVWAGKVGEVNEKILKDDHIAYYKD